MSILKAICPKREYNFEGAYLYTTFAGCRKIVCDGNVGYCGGQVWLSNAINTSALYYDYNPAPTGPSGAAETLYPAGYLLPAMDTIMQRGLRISDWSRNFFIRNPSTAVVKLTVFVVELKNDFTLSYTYAGVQHTNTLMSWLNNTSLMHHRALGVTCTTSANSNYPGTTSIANYDLSSGSAVNVTPTTDNFKFITNEMKQDIKLVKLKKYTMLPGQEIDFKIKIPSVIYDQAENLYPYASLYNGLDYFEVEARKKTTRLVFFDFHGDMGVEYAAAPGAGTSQYSKPNWKAACISVVIKDHFAVTPRFLGIQREQLQENVYHIQPGTDRAVVDPEDQNEN